MRSAAPAMWSVKQVLSLSPGLPAVKQMLQEEGARLLSSRPFVVSLAAMLSLKVRGVKLEDAAVSLLVLSIALPLVRSSFEL